MGNHFSKKEVVMVKGRKVVTTVSLPEREYKLLGELSHTRGLSKGNLIAHALRVLSALDQKAQSGAKLYLEDEQKNKAELVMV